MINIRMKVIPRQDLQGRGVFALPAPLSLQGPGARYLCGACGALVVGQAKHEELQKLALKCWCGAYNVVEPLH